MEEKLLKLTAQLTVIFVVAYVTVRAFAPAQTKGSGSGRWGRQRARGDVWNHTPVAAPSSEDGLAFGPAPIF
jgi:hypothetical protein